MARHSSTLNVPGFGEVPIVALGTFDESFGPAGFGSDDEEPIFLTPIQRRLRDRGGLFGFGGGALGMLNSLTFGGLGTGLGGARATRTVGGGPAAAPATGGSSALNSVASTAAGIAVNGGAGGGASLPQPQRALGLLDLHNRVADLARSRIEVLSRSPFTSHRSSPTGGAAALPGPGDSTSQAAPSTDEDDDGFGGGGVHRGGAFYEGGVGDEDDSVDDSPGYGYDTDDEEHEEAVPGLTDDYTEYFDDEDEYDEELYDTDLYDDRDDGNNSAMSETPATGSGGADAADRALGELAVEAGLGPRPASGDSDRSLSDAFGLVLDGLGMSEEEEPLLAAHRAAEGAASQPRPRPGGDGAAAGVAASHHASAWEVLPDAEPAGGDAAAPDTPAAGPHGLVDSLVSAAAVDMGPGAVGRRRGTSLARAWAAARFALNAMLVPLRVFTFVAGLSSGAVAAARQPPRRSVPQRLPVALVARPSSRAQAALAERTAAATAAPSVGGPSARSARAVPREHLQAPQLPQHAREGRMQLHDTSDAATGAASTVQLGQSAALHAAAPAPASSAGADGSSTTPFGAAEQQQQQQQRQQQNDEEPDLRLQPRARPLVRIRRVRRRVAIRPFQSGGSAAGAAAVAAAAAAALAPPTQAIAREDVDSEATAVAELELSETLAPRPVAAEGVLPAGALPPRSLFTATGAEASQDGGGGSAAVSRPVPLSPVQMTVTASVEEWCEGAPGASHSEPVVVRAEAATSVEWVEGAGPAGPGSSSSSLEAAPGGTDVVLRGEGCDQRRVLSSAGEAPLATDDALAAATSAAARSRSLGAAQPRRHLAWQDTAAGDEPVAGGDDGGASAAASVAARRSTDAGAEADEESAGSDGSVHELDSDSDPGAFRYWSRQLQDANLEQLLSLAAFRSQGPEELQGLGDAAPGARGPGGSRHRTPSRAARLAGSSGTAEAAPSGAHSASAGGQGPSAGAAGHPDAGPGAGVWARRLAAWSPQRGLPRPFGSPRALLRSAAPARGPAERRHLQRQPSGLTAAAAGAVGSEAGATVMDGGTTADAMAAVAAVPGGAPLILRGSRYTYPEASERLQRLLLRRAASLENLRAPAAAPAPLPAAEPVGTLDAAAAAPPQTAPRVTLLRPDSPPGIPAVAGGATVRTPAAAPFEPRLLRLPDTDLRVTALNLLSAAGPGFGAGSSAAGAGAGAGPEGASGRTGGGASARRPRAPATSATAALLAAAAAANSSPRSGLWDATDSEEERQRRRRAAQGISGDPPAIDATTLQPTTRPEGSAGSGGDEGSGGGGSGAPGRSRQSLDDGRWARSRLRQLGGAGLFGNRRRPQRRAQQQRSWEDRWLGWLGGAHGREDREDRTDGGSNDSLDGSGGLWRYYYSDGNTDHRALLDQTRPRAGASLADLLFPPLDLLSLGGHRASIGGAAADGSEAGTAGDGALNLWGVPWEPTLNRSPPRPGPRFAWGYDPWAIPTRNASPPAQEQRVAASAAAARGGGGIDNAGGGSSDIRSTPSTPSDMPGLVSDPEWSPNSDRRAPRRAHEAQAQGQVRQQRRTTRWQRGQALRVTWASPWGGQDPAAAAAPEPAARPAMVSPSWSGHLAAALLRSQAFASAVPASGYLIPQAGWVGEQGSDGSGPGFGVQPSGEGLPAMNAAVRVTAGNARDSLGALPLDLELLPLSATAESSGATAAAAAVASVTPNAGPRMTLDAAGQEFNPDGESEMELAEIAGQPSPPSASLAALQGIATAVVDEAAAARVVQLAGAVPAVPGLPAAAGGGVGEIEERPLSAPPLPARTPEGDGVFGDASDVDSWVQGPSGGEREGDDLQEDATTSWLHLPLTGLRLRQRFVGILASGPSTTAADAESSVAVGDEAALGGWQSAAGAAAAAVAAASASAVAARGRDAYGIPYLPALSIVEDASGAVLASADGGMPARRRGLQASPSSGHREVPRAWRSWQLDDATDGGDSVGSRGSQGDLRALLLTSQRCSPSAELRADGAAIPDPGIPSGRVCGEGDGSDSGSDDDLLPPLSSSDYDEDEGGGAGVAKGGASLDDCYDSDDDLPLPLLVEDDEMADGYGNGRESVARSGGLLPPLFDEAAITGGPSAAAAAAGGEVDDDSDKGVAADQHQHDGDRASVEGEGADDDVLFGDDDDEDGDGLDDYELYDSECDDHLQGLDSDNGAPVAGGRGQHDRETAGGRTRRNVGGQPRATDDDDDDDGNLEMPGLMSSGSSTCSSSDGEVASVRVRTESGWHHARAPATAPTPASAAVSAGAAAAAATPARQLSQPTPAARRPEQRGLESRPAAAAWQPPLRPVPDASSLLSPLPGLSSPWGHISGVIRDSRVSSPSSSGAGGAGPGFSVYRRMALVRDPQVAGGLGGLTERDGGLGPGPDDSDSGSLPPLVSPDSPAAANSRAVRSPPSSPPPLIDSGSETDSGTSSAAAWPSRRVRLHAAFGRRQGETAAAAAAAAGTPPASALPQPAPLRGHRDPVAELASRRPTNGDDTAATNSGAGTGATGSQSSGGNPDTAWRSAVEALLQALFDVRAVANSLGGAAGGIGGSGSGPSAAASAGAGLGATMGSQMPAGAPPSGLLRPRSNAASGGVGGGGTPQIAASLISIPADMLGSVPAGSVLGIAIPAGTLSGGARGATPGSTADGGGGGRTSAAGIMRLPLGTMSAFPTSWRSYLPPEDASGRHPNDQPGLPGTYEAADIPAWAARFAPSWVAVAAGQTAASSSAGHGSASNTAAAAAAAPAAGAADLRSVGDVAGGVEWGAAGADGAGAGRQFLWESLSSFTSAYFDEDDDEDDDQEQRQEASYGGRLGAEDVSGVSQQDDNESLMDSLPGLVPLACDGGSDGGGGGGGGGSDQVDDGESVTDSLPELVPLEYAATVAIPAAAPVANSAPPVLEGAAAAAAAAEEGERSRDAGGRGSALQGEGSAALRCGCDETDDGDGGSMYDDGSDDGYEEEDDGYDSDELPPLVMETDDEEDEVDDDDSDRLPPLVSEAGDSDWRPPLVSESDGGGPVTPVLLGEEDGDRDDDDGGDGTYDDSDVESLPDGIMRDTLHFESISLADMAGGRAAAPRAEDPSPDAGGDAVWRQLTLREFEEEAEMWLNAESALTASGGDGRAGVGDGGDAAASDDDAAGSAPPLARGESGPAPVIDHHHNHQSAATHTPDGQQHQSGGIANRLTAAVSGHGASAGIVGGDATGSPWATAAGGSGAADGQLSDWDSDVPRLFRGLPQLPLPALQQQQQQPQALPALREHNSAGPFLEATSWEPAAIFTDNAPQPGPDARNLRGSSAPARVPLPPMPPEAGAAAPPSPSAHAPTTASRYAGPAPGEPDAAPQGLLGDGLPGAAAAGEAAAEAWRRAPGTVPARRNAVTYPRSVLLGMLEALRNAEAAMGSALQGGSRGGAVPAAGAGGASVADLGDGPAAWPPEGPTRPISHIAAAGALLCDGVFVGRLLAELPGVTSDPPAWCVAETVRVLSSSGVGVVASGRA